MDSLPTYYHHSSNIVFDHLFRLRESKSVHVIVFPFLMRNRSYELGTSLLHYSCALIELVARDLEQKRVALSTQFLSFVNPTANKIHNTCGGDCRLPSNNRSHFFLNKVIQLRTFQFMLFRSSTNNRILTFNLTNNHAPINTN